MPEVLSTKEGQLKPLVLTATDIVETRHGGERMLISPKEFKWLLCGGRLTWRRRLLRLITRR